MSEKSFGARLGNGKKLKASIDTFVNYEPQSGENSPTDLAKKIDDLEILDDEVGVLVNDFKDCVSERRTVFFEDELSIRKLLSPILSYVSGKYGKDSNQYRVVRSWVMKMRGQRMQPVSSTPDAVTHSVSQMGFCSFIANFKSLIVTLEGFGVTYTPANQNITVDKLNTLHADGTLRNEKVDTAFSLMVPKVDDRVAEFAAFSTLCQCVKNFVKSQYGVRSSQFKIVTKIAV